MSKFKAAVYGGSIAGLGLMAAPAMADTVWVTNSNDSGAGSFRAAVAAASADPSIDTIQFQDNLGTITISSSIVCYCEQSLTIDGRGAAIEFSPSKADDLFVGEDGGNLALKRLTFRSGLNGIVIDVPPHALGVLQVSLYGVTVEGNAEYGLLIDDETNASDAGIGLDVASSNIVDNGAIAGDLDGIRVNERGAGGITASVADSVFTGNAADGLEFDEGGLGDVTLIVRSSTFDGNGVLEVEGDDGLDIDEADNGKIWLTVADATFNDNTDDGIGMDESGAGGINLSLTDVELSRNGDKGVSIDEGGDGDLEAKFDLVGAERNGEDGLNLEETGPGAFEGLVTMSTLRENGEAGIKVAQEATPGSSVLRLEDVTFENNLGGAVDASGVTVVGLGSP